MAVRVSYRGYVSCGSAKSLIIRSRLSGAQLRRAIDDVVTCELLMLSVSIMHPFGLLRLIGIRRANLMG